MRLSFITRATCLTALIAATALAACAKQADAPPPAAPAAAVPAPVAPAAVVPAPEPPTPVATVPPNAREFKIGRLTAFALRDGSIELPNDNKVFGFGRSPADLAAVLSAAGLATDKLQLSIQPLLVKTADRVLLFDTGAGNHFGPGAGKLGIALTEAGVDPVKVTDIFLSHTHGDHLGGLVNAEGTLAFPNATVHLSKPEWAFFSGLTEEAAKKVGFAQHKAVVATMKPKVQAFAPGADVLPGVVKAVDFKGHTPGHSGYQISSGQDSLLYVGDSMHHYVVSVQRPDWAMGFDGDQTTGVKTRAALIPRLAASGQRIYAVHFPFPGLGKFEKRGDATAWVAE